MILRSILNKGLLVCKQGFQVDVSLRCICTSQRLCLQYKRGYGSKWRLKQGQAENRSAYGPLTDLPDYTYIDGRPTPLTKGQVRRRTEKIEMTKRIMGLLEEVDFAKENHQRRLEQQRLTREDVLRNKLNPKA